MVTRYPDRRFAAYGVSADQAAAMRARMVAWRTELLGDAK
jgi:hypothetical protein